MFPSYPEKSKLRKSYNIPGHAHELTFSTWQRHPFFLNPQIAESYVENLKRVKNILNFDVLAYVVMPEHCHLLIWPKGEKYEIARILRSIKGPVAKHVLTDFPKIREQCEMRLPSQKGVIHRFWQPGGGYDRNMWSDEAIQNSIAYIHNNPVKRELCDSPESWSWSSASNPI